MDPKSDSIVARIILLLILLGGVIGAAKTIEKGSRRDEAEVAKIVMRSNEFRKKITNIEEETRALLDPLVFVLEIDHRYREVGLGHMPFREFRKQLAEANQRLIGTSSEEYIDEAAQR